VTIHKKCAGCSIYKNPLEFSEKRNVCKECRAEHERMRRRSDEFVPKKVSPEKSVWKAMKQRCFNPNHKDYKNYGGRGISVCEKWRFSFNSFLEDMGQRPSLAHSIDRIDNNGNYEPDNTKWATIKEQSNNKSTNRIVDIGDEKLTVSELSERENIPYKLILDRLNSGKTGDDLIKPVSVPEKYKLGDEELTIPQIADKVGIRQNTLWRRININKLPLDEAIKPEHRKNKKILFDGIERSVKEISNLTGIPVTTLNWRIRNGLTNDEIFRKKK